jgi:hypothetical protein
MSKQAIFQLTTRILTVRRHTPRSPLLNLDRIVAFTQAGRVSGVAGGCLDDGLLETADGTLWEFGELRDGLGGACGGEVEQGGGPGDLHFHGSCCVLFVDRSEGKASEGGGEMGMGWGSEALLFI